MKYIKNITRVIALIVILISVKLTGCEQEDMDFYIDCDFCLEEIPEYDTLRVSLTIDDENSFVPLEFFIGDYEDGEQDWIDTAYSESFWLVAEVGVNYSVKATYRRGDKTIIAIDGDEIVIVDGEEECYPPCYYTRGGTLDVRLK